MVSWFSMLYDFHSHTFLSDGELSPEELIRRAVVNGYDAIAITDHVGPSNCEAVVRELVLACDLMSRHYPIIALPGVELTHIPPEAIPETARLARRAGAQIVIVHGETIVEPVAIGTNLAAIRCPEVDILAHPGLLTQEEAELAAQRQVYIEISARRGHCLTNGHVVTVGRAAQASFVLDSDAHAPEDLLTAPLAERIVRGAGVAEQELHQVLVANPQALLKALAARGRAKATL
ncbi:MAG: histidinol phosphate phosphatase domain-containing protein [Chloroflexi bacterium]|nr:histidinol phosphate phosphatase domain-containing protein [Chloroflexota bacterium]